MLSRLRYFIEASLELLQFLDSIFIASWTLSCDEFKNVSIDESGWKYDNKKVIQIEKLQQSGTISPVLMSGKVFKEFQKAHPKSIHLKRLGPKNYPNSPNTGSGIYGGNPYWPDINQAKV